MVIYIILEMSIIVLMLVDENQRALREDERRSDRILLFSIVLIYLICVLRSTTVGRDIPGYERIYEETIGIPWENFNYVNFENGYIFLMKVCIKLGLSFQAFFAVVYFIILWPIYLFIKKYSKNKLISVLMYVCYILFEFDLTGLRQALAISIVLLAFIALLEAHRFNKMLYIVLVLVAASFHKSAYVALVFLPLLAIHSLGWYAFSMVIATVVSILARQYLFVYIKELFGKDSFSLNAGLHIGGNIVFMMAIVAFVMFILFLQKRTAINEKGIQNVESKEATIDAFMLKAFMFGIVLSIFFGMETSARSFMYFSQTIMILLPNVCEKVDKRSKFLIKIILVSFFVVFFYFNTLQANSFDIVPYRFFWENK